MNIPNIITIFRLIISPIILLIFLNDFQNKWELSFVLYVLSGLTDIVDGYIARKYNLITNFGKLLDPFADKLVLITILFCLTFNKVVPFFILLIILLKELLMIFGSVVLYKKVNLVVSANIYGKIATFLFYLSIGLILLKIDIGKYLLYLALCFALFAFFVYIIKYLNEYKSIKGTFYE